MVRCERCPVFLLEVSGPLLKIAGAAVCFQSSDRAAQDGPDAATLPYPLQELHCAGVGVEVLSFGKLYLQSSKAGKEDQSPRTQASSGLVGSNVHAEWSSHGCAPEILSGRWLMELMELMEFKIYRTLLRSITRPPACLSPRSQVLAASGHFPGAVHGDLRLENLLVDRGLTHVVAVDFERGIEGVDRYMSVVASVELIHLVVFLAQISFVHEPGRRAVAAASRHFRQSLLYFKLQP
ncbi:hypothetical protein SELMODRAFT_414325 [Selaginella moellendorffii]|uniref:Uncharacterized protein n=1 Tax=Selaginella moellendorffii TaxID=88036 RepID=D8RSD6_SELML|nr:hypothetical protein SELMODRAFT_414325 [Selaginella moellendorffii]